MGRRLSRDERLRLSRRASDGLVYSLEHSKRYCRHSRGGNAEPDRLALGSGLRVIRILHRILGDCFDREWKAVRILIESECVFHRRVAVVENEDSYFPLP